jgi:molybdopterin synthase catalytic subunit
MMSDTGLLAPRESTVDSTWVRLTHARLDVTELVKRVARDGAGATSLFVGTVRDVHRGRRVARLDYEAYEPMAVREMAAVAREVAAAHGAAVAIEHRLGTLEIGEASVVIATSHAHRTLAITACADAIELVKRRVPIWKREHFADGGVDWVDPTREAGA